MLVIVIVIVGIVLLCCIAALVYWYTVKNNPANRPKPAAKAAAPPEPEQPVRKKDPHTGDYVTKEEFLRTPTNEEHAKHTEEEWETAERQPGTGEERRKHPVTEKYLNKEEFADACKEQDAEVTEDKIEQDWLLAVKEEAPGDAGAGGGEAQSEEKKLPQVEEPCAPIAGIPREATGPSFGDMLVTAQQRDFEDAANTALKQLRRENEMYDPDARKEQEKMKMERMKEEKEAKEGMYVMMMENIIAHLHEDELESQMLQWQRAQHDAGAPPDGGGGRRQPSAYPSAPGQHRWVPKTQSPATFGRVPAGMIGTPAPPATSPPRAPAAAFPPPPSGPTAEWSSPPRPSGTYPRALAGGVAPMPPPPPRPPGRAGSIGGKGVAGRGSGRGGPPRSTLVFQSQTRGPQPPRGPRWPTGRSGPGASEAGDGGGLSVPLLSDSAGGSY